MLWKEGEDVEIGFWDAAPVEVGARCDALLEVEKKSEEAV